MKHGPLSLDTGGLKSGFHELNNTKHEAVLDEVPVFTPENSMKEVRVTRKRVPGETTRHAFNNVDFGNVLQDSTRVSLTLVLIEKGAWDAEKCMPLSSKPASLHAFLIGLELNGSSTKLTLPTKFFSAKEFPGFLYLSGGNGNCFNHKEFVQSNIEILTFNCPLKKSHRTDFLSRLSVKASFWLVINIVEEILTFGVIKERHPVYALWRHIRPIELKVSLIRMELRAVCINIQVRLSFVGAIFLAVR